MSVTPCTFKPRAVRDVCTPHGDKYYYRAKLSYDPDTHEKKAEVGEKINLDATIQSYKASCDISTIIARFEAGDESVLNVNPNGLTGDLTILPRDINDLVGVDGLFDKSLESFNKLPDDVKALFHDSPAEFFSSVINNKVDEVLKGYKPKDTSSAEVTDTEKEGE